MKGYLKTIAALNHLPVCHEETWCFFEGMLFRSCAKWWGDFAYRISSHEGLDIGMYRDINNRIIWLHDQVKVPAMAQGVILNICRDFLGKSVIVHHRDCPENDSRFILVYSHIKPVPGIAPEKKVNRCDILGTIADTSSRKSKIPCHLHISIMEISNTIDNCRLNWDLFASPVPMGVNLYNPWMFRINEP